MTSIRTAVLLAGATAVLSACSITGANHLDTGPRRTARLLLTAVEAAQAAILVYGRLPPCNSLPRRLPCRDAAAWTRLRDADRVAAAAVTAAAPVLDGDAADAGETALALAALAGLRDALAASVREGEGRATP